MCYFADFLSFLFSFESDCCEKFGQYPCLYLCLPLSVLVNYFAPMGFVLALNLNSNYVILEEYLDRLRNSWCFFFLLLLALVFVNFALTNGRFRFGKGIRHVFTILLLMLLSTNIGSCTLTCIWRFKKLLNFDKYFE